MTAFEVPGEEFVYSCVRKRRLASCSRFDVADRNAGLEDDHYSAPQSEEILVGKFGSSFRGKQKHKLSSIICTANKGFIEVVDLLIKSDRGI